MNNQEIELFRFANLSERHDPTTLICCVKKAIEDFSQNENYLIDRGLGERCICGKFSMYLERAIRKVDPMHEYDVDTEYDRGCDGYEDAIKRLPDQETGEEKRIIPDLIVHKRGHVHPFGFVNLICIEMKKNGTPSKMKDDKERLRRLTSDEEGFGYIVGIMLNAKTKYKTQANGIFIDSIYVNGTEYLYDTVIN